MGLLLPGLTLDRNLTLTLRLTVPEKSKIKITSRIKRGASLATRGRRFHISAKENSEYDFERKTER
jgi:hypothetical protein